MISQEIKKEIIRDINKEESLLKYSYLDKGVNSFLEVINSPNYYTFKNEMNLINKYKNKLQEGLKENIVILGVGDGRKAKELLAGLKIKNLTIIDISSEMISLAKENLSIYNPRIINKEFEEIRFENLEDNTTFILLGGTLLNFKDWVSFLLRIKNGFHNSNIILGVELLEKECNTEEVVNQYNTEAFFKYSFFPLESIGLTRKHGFVKQIYNHKREAVETWFILDKKEDIKKRIGIKKNVSKALLCMSIKLKEQEFYEEIKKYDKLLDYKRGNNHIISIGF